VLEPLKYYIQSRGRVQGPFTVEELVERQKRGQFARYYQVSTDGEHWERASQHAELFPGVAPPAKPDVGPANRGSEVIPLADDEPEEIPLAEDPESTWANPSDAGIPLSEPASGADADESWYYTRDGREAGPVAFAHLQFLVANGELGFRDFVWNDGMPSWAEVRNVPGLLAVSTSRSAAAEREETPAETSPLAVTSFMFGLLGTSLLFFLGSIAAVVLGHIALKQIDESRGRLAGRGLALSGLVLGYVVLVAATVIGIVVLLVSALQTPPAG